jgi:HlyD family secretion protein
VDIQRPDTGKRQRRRIALAAAGILILAALVVTAVSLANRPPAIDRDSIWTGRVIRGELVHEIAANGTLIAPELRAVANRSEGVVEVIHVLPGQVVAPDDVLIEIESPTLEDDLADARWELAAAEAEESLSRMETENRFLDIIAQLASAESEYTTSRLELEAYEELGAQRIASELDVERVRLRTEQLRRRMEAEQARLDSYEASRAAQEQSQQARVARLRERVVRLESRVDQLKVRAGGHGVVQEVNVQVGERLQAGHAVARVVNPARLIARIGVAERDAATVEPGLPVRLEIGRNILSGKVSRIDPTVRDRLVTVDVELDSHGDAQLRPDLSVIARIELQRVAGTLVVDRPAGLRGGFETLELWRVERGDRVRRVTVELGGASARHVEILNGLAEGDTIVLADLSEWVGVPELRLR